MKLKYIFWEDDNYWLGHLEDYPDYMTQAESIEELKENLSDIFLKLESGSIPAVRKTGELEVA